MATNDSRVVDLSAYNKEPCELGRLESVISEIFTDFLTVSQNFSPQSLPKVPGTLDKMPTGDALF